MTNPEFGHAELEGEDPQIEIPAATSTLFARLGILALALLVVYLVAITQIQSRQNGEALQDLEKAQQRTISQLDQAKKDQQALLDYLKQHGIAITSIGDPNHDGKPDYVIASPTAPTPSAAPVPSASSSSHMISPRVSTTPAPARQPTPAAHPAPAATPAPAPAPAPSRSPTPAPSPLVGCLTTPLGRVCA